MSMIERTIKEGKSLKQTLGKVALGKKEVISLMNENGQEINDRFEILKVVENYYEQLYSSKIVVHPTELSVDYDDVPDIGIDEVRHALKDMKRGRAPAEDGILADF